MREVLRDPVIEEPPEVSVVIPTRNRWDLLSTAALPSALGQEDVSEEVIVVDDGSTDETPARLAELQDRRLRVFRHSLPRGVSAARNTGIAAARGPWLAFLDDDDLWDPRKLRTQLDVASSSGATLVYAGVVVLNQRRHVMYVTRSVSTDHEELLARDTIPAGSSNVLARADAVRSVGGFDERLSFVADWDLWIKLTSSGTLAVCAEFLVGYVRHGDGMVFAGRDAVREMRYFVEKHRAAGLKLDPAGFLSWVASEDRGARRRVHAASTYFRSALAFRRPGQFLRAAASLIDTRGAGLVQPLRRTRRHAPEPVPDIPWLERYR